MSQLGMILQESVAAGGGGGGGGGQESRTILAFLRQQMDGVDHDGRRSSTRLSFKERLGLKGLGCCGTTWAFRAPTTVSVGDDHDDEGEENIVVVMNLDHRADPLEREPDPGCLSPITAATRGMNLAAALAAERQFRTDTSSYNGVGPTNSRVGSPRGGLISAPGTPMRVSLMRLIEETDGQDVEMVVGTEKEKESSNGCGVGGGSDTVCCVCMVRKKGAAFIPCGHTFCRVCSREVWLNRGSCPLCNRSILEILDIF